MRSTTIGRVALVLILLVGVSSVGVGSPVSAQQDVQYAHVNGCASAGNIGVYSGHSNSQVCNFGFFACVQTNPAASQFTSSSLMPPTTVGMIMMPFGADWQETGGNNGYVENVCNGRAAMSNVITMVSNINADKAWEPFPQQLSLIQGLCGGQCRAEFMVLSTVPLRLNEDNSIVVRDNMLAGNPLEQLMVHNYITQGGINRGGLMMGADGYHDGILQVIEAEESGKGWTELAHGLTREFEYHNIAEVAIRIIAFFFV